MSTFIKEKEKEILSKVVNDFIRERDYIENLIEKEGNEKIMKEFLFKEYELQDKGVGYIHNISTILIPYIKQTVSLLKLPVINKMIGKIHKMLRDTVMSIIEFDNENEMKNYLDKMMSFFIVKCIEFDEFIKKYDFINNVFFLKEYALNFFTNFLLLPFGKINDWELFEKILKIWILNDNISDSSGANGKVYINEIFNFFMNKMYLDETLAEEFFKKKGSPLIDCFSEIWYLKWDNTDKRKKVFGRLRKLCKFSYLNKNALDKELKDEKKILKYTCLKTRKSIDIFIYSMELQDKKFIFRKKWNEEFMRKYYSLSLAIQLADDLYDIKKDEEEQSISIFTTSISNKNNERRRLANIITMHNIFKKHGGIIKNLLRCMTLLFTYHAENYLDKDVIEILHKNTQFINLKGYNFALVESLLEDRKFTREFLEIYQKK